MSKRELIAAAEALEWASDYNSEVMGHVALIYMIRDRAKELRAQAEAAQEPVAVGTVMEVDKLPVAGVYSNGAPFHVPSRKEKTAMFFKDLPVGTSLYTAPPALSARLAEAEILLRRIEPALSAAAAGSRISMAAGDLKRDIGAFLAKGE